MRVFLDTNVLVSAFTARGLCADLLRLILAEHELLTGEVNLVELRRIMADRFHASPQQLQVVEEQLREHTIIPRPAVPSRLPIRDLDDAWVLASALAGRAEIVVSGDQDLQAVAGAAPVPIVSPRQSWERLRGAS